MKEIEHQKLLNTRICDLELDIYQSYGHTLDKLKKELEQKNIRLWPDFYFGEEWGADNKTISISIPFYYATPELKKLGEKIEDIENNGYLEKSFRHEIGHPMNYAFELWKRKEWKKIFGDFNKPYPRGKKYLRWVNPQSRDFVKYLHYDGEKHYAQQHPDDDWAETFATYLDPKSGWKRKYKNYPGALKKIYFTDKLMEELAGKEPINIKTKRDGEYKEIKETVSEWFGEKVNKKIKEYFDDMKELFDIKDKRRSLVPAHRLINLYANQMAERTSAWIDGSNQHSVRRCLRQWEIICRKENLGFLPEEYDQKIIELSGLLTYHTLKSIRRIKNGDIYK